MRFDLRGPTPRDGRKKMSMGNKTGLVGWRGMVGSVLMQRMREENDFDMIGPVRPVCKMPTISTH
jgi:Semialdehyde dehydrogenase, NAD binding domain